MGGYRYEDGTRYIGDWNQKGQKHGLGHLLLPDGTRYGKEKMFILQKEKEIKKFAHRWIIQQWLMQWAWNYEFCRRIKVKIYCI